MIYKQNILTKNLPMSLALAFGFEKNYRIANIKGVEHIKDNNEHKCMMCGRAQESGYIDKKRTLISNNSNDFYTFTLPDSPFLCDYCYYCHKHYKKSMQKDLDTTYGDLTNIVLYKDRFERKELSTSNEKNELYDLFKNPPAEAFAIITKQAKTGGFVFDAYKAIPTVDSELLVVNHNTVAYYAPVKKVFSALKDFDKIERELKKAKINFSEDLFFNRSGSTKYNYWFTEKLRSNAVFMELYVDFINKYNRDVRFVAKMIKARYDKEKKNG